MPGPVIADPTPEWLKPGNASVFDPLWQRAARWVGHKLGADDPQSQVAGIAAPMETGPVGGVVGAVQKYLGGIKAYHGTGVEFPPEPGAPLGRFDMSKVGSGQGAQSYGHGLYFAEAEPVAEDMRNQLAPRPKVLVGGQEMPQIPGGGPGRFDLISTGKDVDQVVAARIASKVRQHWSLGRPVPVEDALNMIDAELENGLNMAVSRKDAPLYNHLSDQRLALQRFKEQGVSVPKAGSVYEVNLKVHPNELLDWDKRVAEQPHVLDALSRGGIDIQPARGGQGLRVGGKENVLGSRAVGMLIDKFNPGRFYGAEGAAAEAASQHLLESGIPGTQYLDQFSRLKPIHKLDLEMELGRLQQEAAVMYGNPRTQGPVPSDLAFRIDKLKKEIAGFAPQTRNIVMHTDSLIDILRKFGVLPPLAAGAAYGASQQPSSQVGTPPPVQAPPR